jgi:hypothetical protein
MIVFVAVVSYLCLFFAIVKRYGQTLIKEEEAVKQVTAKKRN